MCYNILKANFENLSLKIEYLKKRYYWHMFNIKAQHSLTHRHELPHEGINAETHKCAV